MLQQMDFFQKLFPNDFDKKKLQSKVQKKKLTFLGSNVEFQICVTTLVWFCLCFDRLPKMCSLVRSSINLRLSTYCQDVLVQPHPEGIMICLLTNQYGFSSNKAILQQNPTSVLPPNKRITFASI